MQAGLWWFSMLALNKEVTPLPFKGTEKVTNVRRRNQGFFRITKSYYEGSVTHSSLTFVLVRKLKDQG